MRRLLRFIMILKNSLVTIMIFSLVSFSAPPTGPPPIPEVKPKQVEEMRKQIEKPRRRIRLPTLPDLYVKEVKCIPPDGKLSFTVANRGAAISFSSTQSMRRLHASVSKIWYGDFYPRYTEEFLGRVDLTRPTTTTGGGIVKAGGTSTYITPFIFDFPHVKVVVDVNDVIDETNEHNNTYVGPYNPCGAAIMPDLKVTVGVVTASLYRGCDLDQFIHVSILNLGHTTALGTKNWPNQGYTVDVVLSSDAVVSVGATAEVSMPTSYRTYWEDMLIGRVNSTEDIPAGGRRGYLLGRYLGAEVGYIPLELPRGRYYICAIVDPNNKVREARENNNVSCQRLPYF